MRKILSLNASVANACRHPQPLIVRVTEISPSKLILSPVGTFKFSKEGAVGICKSSFSYLLSLAAVHKESKSHRLPGIIDHYTGIHNKIGSQSPDTEVVCNLIRTKDKLFGTQRITDSHSGGR